MSGKRVSVWNKKIQNLILQMVQHRIIIQIFQHTTVSTFWIDLNFQANNIRYMQEKFNPKIKLFKSYSKGNVILVEIQWTTWFMTLDFVVE